MSDMNFLQVESECRASYNRYAEGLDKKNWAQVRCCFADEVYLDYGPVIDPSGAPDQARSADAWVEQLHFNIGGFDLTRHTITNHRTVVDGDTIRCTAYLVADHVIFPNPEMAIAGADDVATVIGEYTNEYVREDGVLKIVRSKLVMDWSSGNIELFARAIEKRMLELG